MLAAAADAGQHKGPPKGMGFKSKSSQTSSAVSHSSDRWVAGELRAVNAESDAPQGQVGLGMLHACVCNALRSDRACGSNRWAAGELRAVNGVDSEAPEGQVSVLI